MTWPPARRCSIMVVTSRGAPRPHSELADTATDMRLLARLASGIAASRGSVVSARRHPGGRRRLRPEQNHGHRRAGVGRAVTARGAGVQNRAGCCLIR